MDDVFFVKRKNAYMTVEAAMVMPIVLGCLVFLLYAMLFLYNSTLLEQDLETLTIRCARLGNSISDMERILQEEYDNLYEEKYYAFKKEQFTYSVSKGELIMSKRGSLVFQDAGKWVVERSMHMKPVCPLQHIRLKKKLQNVMEFGEE